MSEPEIGVEPETLSLDLHGRVEGVLTIYLDRPEVKNALSQELQAELVDVLDAVEDRDDVRAVIVTGSPETSTFASGADVSDFQGLSAIEKREMSRKRGFLEVIDEFPRPVIAAMDGYALGGACELAQACDIRVATTDTKLGQPEINLGIIPGGGATQRLPRLVGEGQAMRLVLTGDVIDAEEAREIGLVDILCDPGELLERTDELAEKIATKSPVAIATAKRAVRQASRTPLDSGLSYEKELFALTFASEDKTEGVAAFLEDRDPEWTGR